jgi:predicted DCC family thiol-disulfide oxidoreductase YuxK
VRPGSGVVVFYDERCGGCSQLAGRLDRLSVAVAPIGSELGDRVLSDLGADGRYVAIHAIDRGGRRHSGGRALPVVLAALPGGSLPAALAARFPRAAALLYEQVARNRRHLARLLGLPSA